MLLIWIFLLAPVVFALVLLAPPLILKQLGHGRAAFSLGLAITIALVVDHLYNWEDVTYPHAILSGFSFYFPFTILGAALGLAAGFLGWLDQWGA